MEPLQSVVPGFLRELLRHGPMTQEKLECAWQVAVGPAIARVTTVRLRSDGKVEVRTGDETWRRELNRALPEIEAKLKSLAGAEAIAGLKLVRRAPGAAT